MLNVLGQRLAKYGAGLSHWKSRNEASVSSTETTNARSRSATEVSFTESEFEIRDFREGRCKSRSPNFDFRWCLLASFEFLRVRVRIGAFGSLQRGATRSRTLLRSVIDDVVDLTRLSTHANQLRKTYYTAVHNISIRLLRTVVITVN